MLSVPPAFILSQDQTLNLIRSLLLGLNWPVFSYRSLYASVSKFRRNFQTLRSKVFLLRCYTVRFSKFQSVLSNCRTFAFCAKCLSILSHRFRFVNNFFQVFFNLFRCRSFGANRWYNTTLSALLSTTFSNFFHFGFYSLLRTTKTLLSCALCTMIIVQIAL